MGWLPMGGSVQSTTGAPVAVGSLLVGESPVAKTVLTDLASWETETYEVSGTYAAELGIASVDVSAKVDSRLFVFDFANYVDIGKEQNGRRFTERWGIAVRLIVHVLNLKGSFGLDLAGVAAKASADNLTSHSKLSVRGYQDRSLAPSIADFPTRITVENYSDVYAKLKAIQLKVSSEADAAKVVPQLLALRPDVAAAELSASDAIATVSALQSIVKGWRFADAGGEVQERLGTAALESVRSVYRHVLGLDYETVQPSPDDQDVARGLLRQYELRWR
jgi:hypothetical protein